MMINRFFADVKSESPVPSESYKPNDMNVLDLSRRRDSVETRKTPSPYETSSSYEASSPKVTSKQIHPARRSTSPKARRDTSSITQLGNMFSFPYYYQNLSEAAQTPATKREPSPYQYNPAFPDSTMALNSLPGTRASIPSPFDLIKTAAVIQQPLASRTTPPVRSPGTKLSFTPKDDTKVSHLPPMVYRSLLKSESKASRPFKAYPRDPNALAATFTATDALLDVEKAGKYQVFRKRMLDQMHASNGGQPTVTNPKMRRSVPSNQQREEQATDSCSSNEDHHRGEPAGDSTNERSGDGQSGMVKDAAYYERRRKNNAAAKKSRDRRRIKEDEIAVRAAFLEHENIELRIEIAALKNQIAMITAKSSR